MKYLFVLPLLLALALWPWSTARQQTMTISPTPLDTLIKHKQYEEALPLLETMRQTDSLAGDWAAYQAHSIQTATILTNKEDFQGVQGVIDHALTVLQKNGLGNRPSTARLWSWLAVNHGRQEHYAESLACYQAALKIYEQADSYGAGVGYAYKNAAQVYMRYSNYRQAITYLEAGLRRDTTGQQHPSIYAQLASSWLFLDSLPAARQAYAKGLATHGKDPAYLESLHSIGAALALRNNDLQSAERLTQAALAIAQTIPTAGANCLRYYASLADIADRSGRKTEAADFFQQGETFGKAYYQHKKSREMAILYLAWGGFLEKKGALEAALQLYQKAVIQVFPGFDNASVAANPPLSGAYIESQAMFALACKGAALLKKTVPTPADRLNAADCFDLSFAVAAKLRQTYGDDADKLTLAGDNRAYQRLAVLNLWQLYRQEKDAAPTLTRLFQLLEQSKAQALADAVRQQRALASSGIPDSLLVREQTLRLAAAETDLALRVAALEEKQTDSLQAVRQQEQAFKAQKNYADFLAGLEKQYPSFQQFTTQAIPVDPTTVQAALPDSAALLSWFDAGDRYLCLVVRRTGWTAYEVRRDSAFDQRLSGFLLRLADKSAQENAPGDYFAEAFALGQQLLPVVATAGLRQLVIIPDGRLCYLPFEALLTAPYTGNFAQAPYLLRTHTVQYAWSATLLTLAADSQSNDNQGFLQIVPFAKTTRDGLALLPNSLRDKPEDLAATVLVGEQASVAGFLQNASQYGVLHLSTHANAGGKGQPGVEFYDRQLTLPEVYAQRFHASLVSLSACETGTGQFATGEGVLSLARAFAYAGARSLVASHWAVNERSTADLFSAFYAHLAKGWSKSEALRQAKLAYLASDEMDARKAPYQWAAFTLTGADGQVTFGEPWGQYWPLLVGGLGLAALGFWFFGSRKKS